MLSRWIPSIFSVNVIGVPLAPVSAMPIVTTPVTLAPSAGLVNDAVSGGGSVTVTLRVAVAVRPAPSRTVRPRVCGPLGTLLAFQLNDAVAAVPEVVKTCVPSTVSVKTIGVPLAPVSDIPTVTLPNTVAPSAGLVNDATSGGGPPAMTTVRLALPVLFVESRTLTVAVCVPPEAPVLFHGIEIGPLAVVAVVATAVPSMLSVRFRVPAAAFSSQIVNQIGLLPPSSRSVQLIVPVPPVSLMATGTVPLTVAPSARLVIAALRAGCVTVMCRVAVHLRPAPSCTVAVSVCGPSATIVVSKLQLRLLVVPDEAQNTMVPSGGRRGSSTLKVQLSVPVPPLCDTDTVIVPPTVAPSGGLVNDSGMGVGVVTVTLRVAVAVLPAPSRTVRPSVCGPSATLFEFQLNDAVVAVPEVVKTWMPSTVRVNTIGVPVPPVSDIPTVTVPLTVAPSAGLVNDATNCWPFAMLTTRGALPVLPAESRALAMTVVGPSLNCFVFHPIEIGPDDVSVVVATTVPPTLSV